MPAANSDARRVDLEQVRRIESSQRVVARIVPNVPAIKISALGDDAQLMGALYSALELAEARLFAIAGENS